MLAPSLWKGLANHSSSGGFMPTGTVSEKMESVNGSVRRLLPLFTELPRRVVLSETELLYSDTTYKKRRAKE